jgi:hypothetical protein
MPIITKMEAAHRQLRVAIKLWFEDGDQVAIHSLAAAAHQIIHDLNRKKRGPALLFDTDLIPKEQRQAFVTALKSASWFMKHADRGRTGAAAQWDFDPDLNVQLIMFAIFGIKYLEETFTIEEVAFERWHALNNPHLMTEEGRELFEKQFPADTANRIRSVPKREFFEGLCDLLRKG